MNGVDKKKAEQLDRVFKHLKQPDGAKKLKADPKNAVPNLDQELVDVLSTLDEQELQLLSKVNEKLFDAGFGVSPEFRVSMV